MCVSLYYMRRWKDDCEGRKRRLKCWDFGFTFFEIGFFIILNTNKLYQVHIVLLYMLSARVRTPLVVVAL